MVQRKVPIKLVIQAADHVQSEKGLVSHKPSSSQHQDGKNRGGDLKKKMKKSRSVKRSDFESLRSPPPLRDKVPQPGKPPPLVVPTTAATPQKQSPAKATEVSPNYMKSTSSFDARKEHSSVSSGNSKTIIAAKSPSQKNSNNLKHGLDSGHKVARTLTRTSSLKLVRTLTKTPSFKPARALSRKCSPEVLCENLDVQRATCSSTLKDSKFPNYLMLSPGATESEGTSATKVCPYTYCSLNGHHHAPLPPLKSFLSVRRRMLKAQKSIKLGCLSPRRAKPSGDSMKETEPGKVIFSEKSFQELDLFIEIHSKGEEDTADTIRRSKHNEDFKETDDIMPSDGGSDETEAKNGDGNIVKSLSDESPRSVIDFKGHPHQSGDVISKEMDITDFFPEEEQPLEAAAELDPSFRAQEETTPEGFSNQQDSEVESPASIQLDESDSQASDMDWKAGPHSAPCLDDIPIFTLLEIDNRSSIDEEPIFNSDDIVKSCCKEILVYEVLQGSYDEESVSSEAWFDDGNSESDGSYQNLEGYESILVSSDHSHDRISPTPDAFEDLSTTEEAQGNTKPNDYPSTESTWESFEHTIEEPKATSEDTDGVPQANNEITRMQLQLEDDETNCTSNMEEEILVDQENESPQDYASVVLGNQEADSSHDFSEQDQDEIYKDNTAGHDSNGIYQPDAVTESSFIKEVSNGSLEPKTEDSETEQNCLQEELPTADAGYETEANDQIDVAKSSAGIQTPDLLQGFSEADHDKSSEKNNESQLGAIAEDSELNQTFDDKGPQAETQGHSSDKQSQSNNVDEKQDNSESDRGEAKRFVITNPMESEYQTESEMKRLGLAENGDQDVDKMEVEYTSKINADETSSTAKSTSSKETKNPGFHVRNKSNQEPFETCKNLKGTIRCKKPVEDLEETGKFNPREPNYLPVEPDPEAEKVDLRHQMTDERKNAEEWMVDYALRQAVTKLTPARKRKVALLVEAFETVTPIPKYETHLRHTSAAFAHARPIQACR